MTLTFHCLVFFIISLSCFTAYHFSNEIFSLFNVNRFLKILLILLFLFIIIIVIFIIVIIIIIIIIIIILLLLLLLLL